MQPKVNGNHVHHPAKEYLRTGDDADIALRLSLVQWMPVGVHKRYHDLFTGPSKLSTRSEKFRECVLGCMRVVPSKALDIHKDGKEVEISPGQRAIIMASISHDGWDGTVGSSRSRNAIGRFFAQYALEQSFRDVANDLVIDEFLETKNKASEEVGQPYPIICH